jgi:hypothetical protein
MNRNVETKPKRDEMCRKIFLCPEQLDADSGSNKDEIKCYDSYSTSGVSSDNDSKNILITSRDYI